MSYWWWVSTPETCRAAYRNVINWIQSHLFGKLLSLWKNITNEYPETCRTAYRNVINWIHSHLFGKLLNLWKNTTNEYPETCRTAYRNVRNRIQSHLVGKLLNLIHDARTREYKKVLIILEVSGYIFEKRTDAKFHENLSSVETSCSIRTDRKMDGRTNGQTDKTNLTVAFGKFASSAKNRKTAIRATIPEKKYIVRVFIYVAPLCVG